MPDDSSISVFNLGPFAKPADTLIKKVSEAIGGVFAPHQITRLAKADAEAMVIRAQAEIQVTDLHRRAMHRFVEEEAQRQNNIEEITNKAIPLLQETTDASKMQTDWVTNFFDKSRIVSDQEMQELWARVLAGEANTPGTFSKRTVNFLSDLDKNDAVLFQSLCSFGWFVGSFTPLIFDCQDKIYNDKGLNFAALTHLDSIGLIRFDSIAGFNRIQLPKRFITYYCGQPLAMEFPNEKDNILSIGQVILTNLGKELINVSKVPGVAGYYDYVKEKWNEHLPKITETEQAGSANPHASGTSGTSAAEQPLLPEASGDT